MVYKDKSITSCWRVSSLKSFYVNYVNFINQAGDLGSTPFSSERFPSSFLRIRPEDLILFRINLRNYDSYRLLVALPLGHRQASTCTEEKQRDMQAQRRIRIQDPKFRVLADSMRCYNQLNTKISHPFPGTQIMLRRRVTL
jgi:hypothetical protein